VVPSGEQQPNIRTHHIVHPRQTEQDALNEFAGKLVHPPERHVAHIRMPHSYHRVKLVGPMASVAPPFQVDRVRKRSQEEYQTPDLRDEVEPPLIGEETEGRRISRRPRSQPDPAQDNLPHRPEDQDPSAGAEEALHDQNGESKTAESEGVSQWHAYIDERRRDAEQKGHPFIVVSDWEIIVVNTPEEPGPRLRMIYRYDPQTDTTSIIGDGGYTHRDTGKTTWLSEAPPEQPEDEDPIAADVPFGAEQGMRDQSGGSNPAEPEYLTGISLWDRFIERTRRRVEREGKRFIVVSARQIIEEKIPEPGDTMTYRLVHRYDDETGKILLGSNIGNIDPDTGEITWV
jgi:hypothetical protein